MTERPVALTLNDGHILWITYKVEGENESFDFDLDSRAIYQVVDINSISKTMRSTVFRSFTNQVLRDDYE